MKKCVKQRLLPFIQQYHSDDRYIFWKDLVAAHNANFTLETFSKLNISYIKKDLNPPVVPHLRPRVYKHNWEAHYHFTLKNRITYCLKKMDSMVISEMMSHVRLNIGRANRSVFNV